MSATVLDELHGGASAELRFKLMGYFCAGDESINYGEKMAGYVSKGLDRGLWGSRDPSMPSWVVRPDKTALGVAHIESGKVLMPVEVTLSWKRNAKDLALDGDERLANDMSKFDALFDNLARLLRSRNLQSVMGMEKSALLCWFVWDLNRPGLAKLSRWVLSAPENPILLPAERVEQVIFNLTTLRLNAPETIGVPCDGQAVLDCIAFQLEAQNKAFNELCRNLEDLLQESPFNKTQLRSTIKKNIAALEKVGATVTMLVAFFEKNIGRAPRTEGTCPVVTKLKELIRGPYSTVAINNREVETLKASARKDLATLRRTAPILAAHIRLYDSDHRFELRGVCSTFSPSLRHSDMLDKLNISLSELERTESCATQLGRVRKHYQNTYVNLVITLRKLEKLVNTAYASHGESLFNMGGKWVWFGKKIERGQSVRSTKGELKSENNEESEKTGKFEKWDDRASVDTEVTYCEKVEPLWLV